MFLNIYVDDLQLAGLACNIKGIWDELSKHLDLDPPVVNTDAVYLGCWQRKVKPDMSLVVEPQFTACVLKVPGKERPIFIGEVPRDTNQILREEECLKEHFQMTREAFLALRRR